MSRPSQETQKPLGIAVFGVLLILSSLLHIHKLIVELQDYVDIYSYLPAGWIVSRYAFSWAQRIVGILVGVGLLGKKEIARKIFLALSCFTILALYWKHPYAGVKQHCDLMQEQLSGLLSPFGIRDASSFMAPCVMAGLWIQDIIFFGTALYYFTRPAVRRHFR